MTASEWHGTAVLGGELEVEEETTTVTIHGDDTTTQVRRRQARIRGRQHREDDRKETAKVETIEDHQEMATEMEERQHGRREEGVGLTGIAFGAGTCLLLILLTILRRRKK